MKVPYEASSGGFRDSWNVFILNPDDAAALRAAIAIKEVSPETHVTAVHLGPRSGERFLREALALGCDDAVRIWDDDLYVHSFGKALILTRAAEVLGFDLILTGTTSDDTANNELAVLCASRLGVPCVIRAIRLHFAEKRAVATTRLSEGWIEKREAPLPLVIAMERADEDLPYAGFPAVMEAAERPIRCFDLSDIGLSREVVRQGEASLVHGPLAFPSPPFTPAPAPDSSLPAYERREKLRVGSLAKREGKVVSGDGDMVVEEIFQHLLREGWLSHLDPKQHLP